MTRQQIALVGAAAAFCLVAILNCGGYRYGIGDQAFYGPAVVQHFDPNLFPRDRFLLRAQDRFMLFDDMIAGLARGLGVSVPALFFAGYLIVTALIFGGIVAVGKAMYQSWWTIALLAALMTLRHRITQTGANTLEAYFHPRMMAFALGVWAIASYLRGRDTAALALVVLAFAMHPTTALWFGIWIATALAVSNEKWRAPLAALAALGVAVAAWSVLAGPLRGHLQRMDPLWASVMAGKDYIFPSDWGAAFWIVNPGYLVVVIAIYQYRRRSGTAMRRELGLVAGGAALVAVFLISWPLMTASIALALQLQVSRVFWMLDLLASIYIAWLLVESPSTRFARKAIVLAVITIAIGRGIYIMNVEHAGEPIARVGFSQDNWADVMSWIATTPTDTHVLADPGHAWKYGTSVRVAGRRDVYLEDVKDTALALYSREVAMWVLGRIQDAQSFDSLTPVQLRALADRYDLDYLVVEREIDLPVAYRYDQFRVYSLASPAK
jgi:hypothetical protein